MGQETATFSRSKFVVRFMLHCNAMGYTERGKQSAKRQAQHSEPEYLLETFCPYFAHFKSARQTASAVLPDTV